MLSFELLQTLSAMAELLKLKSMVLGAASGLVKVGFGSPCNPKPVLLGQKVEKGEGSEEGGDDRHYCSSSS